RQLSSQTIHSFIRGVLSRLAGFPLGPTTHSPLRIRIGSRTKVYKGGCSLNRGQNAKYGQKICSFLISRPHPRTSDSERSGDEQKRSRADINPPTATCTGPRANRQDGGPQGKTNWNT